MSHIRLRKYDCNVNKMTNNCEFCILQNVCLTILLILWIVICKSHLQWIFERIWSKSLFKKLMNRFKEVIMNKYFYDWFKLHLNIDFLIVWSMKTISTVFMSNTEDIKKWNNTVKKKFNMKPIKKWIAKKVLYLKFWSNSSVYVNTHLWCEAYGLAMLMGYVDRDLWQEALLL